MRAPLMRDPRAGGAVIVALYAYQGLVAGFALTALPNHYAALGATADQVGAHIATVGLPWILQPLWGPVVDRFGGLAMGRRRFWVVAALAASLLALARLLLVADEGPAGLPAISAVFLLHSALAALTDTATDAMVMDHVPPARLGTANALTRVGFVTGTAAGAAIFAWALPAFGLHAAAAGVLAMGSLVLVLPLLVREEADDAVLSLRRAPGRPASRGLLALLADLGRDLRGGTAIGLLVFCFATDFAAAAFRVPLGVELIQGRGWSAESLSGFQAVAALLTGTAGALLIGWWTDRAGTGRALAILLLLCGLAHAGAGVALLAQDPRWASTAGAVALGLSAVMPALLFVALAPAVMRASLGPTAATRFALFMASLNMGDVAGSALGGRAAEWLGLPALGLAAAAVFLGLGLLSRVLSAGPGWSASVCDRALRLLGRIRRPG
ncbi:MFS transporter [Muricoccus radiodurans]|uniref:MFS transporter n=1 Tax=Muricoccus radiodurans TaxID=2231721 RepID=UPI003CEB473B